jgi:DNA repair exonuclease SbcCD nuclease subunit
MKLLICGDLHLSNKTPQRRTDDFRETSIKKFRFLLQTAKDQKVDLILQPGDFTYSPLLTWSFFNEIIEEINRFKINMEVIAGQHDLLYRTKGNTALDAIACACPTLNLCNYTKPSVKYEGIAAVYASAFGEPLPKIMRNEEELNILLTHRMVVDKKLWASQENFEYGKSLLDQTDFDIIVSGDNHQHFVIEQKKKHKILFNCGSMLRSNIDQVNHKPAFYIFNTDTYTYEKVYFPIQPAEEVFAIDAVEEKKELDANMLAFREKLKEQKAVGLKFEDNMRHYLNNQDNVRPQVKELIFAGMKEV